MRKEKGKSKKEQKMRKWMDRGEKGGEGGAPATRGAVSLLDSTENLGKKCIRKVKCP